MATSFEPMLRELGVSLDADLAVEPSREALPAQFGHPLGPYYALPAGEHAITAHLQGQPVLILGARSVRALDEDRVHVILAGSPASYAATDLPALWHQLDLGELQAGDRDIAGPTAYAVATQVEVTGRAPDEEREHPGGRVVVLGSAGLFDAELFVAPIAANRLFVSAAVGWLARREALAEIPPRSFRHRPVAMTAEDASNMFWRVVLLMPAAFVFLGFAVWWSRRQ
jgi:hypothetical protein